MDCNLAQPWYDAVKNGTKRVEGRVKRNKWSNVSLGDRWRVGCSERDESFFVEVIAIREYGSFEEYIIQEGLRNVLPGVSDLRSGIELYEKYCGQGSDREFGVIAFELKLVN
jgi:ASC-1-like (ASCH) protein